ncbi:kiwellin-like [Rhodamnia argentea]|uniref:Kiwellin-like n=1 Tax=Rhodamnia argentea TaxID=178133 RepID=A0ABM3HL46_9MYRT|nr:kiwellin-like [Rhodamnia argentea]
MKHFVALFLAPPIVISIALFSSPSHAVSSCNGPCQIHDDPDVGAHTYASTLSSSDGGCRPSGTLHRHGRSYPKYRCSPPVTSSTRATLTNNDFSEGGGSGASECGGRFHGNSELIVAMSTGWYAGGSRCGHRIKIRSRKTGRSVTAKVVDECDSVNGCAGGHDGEPPCRNNIVDGSNAVWHALGLDIGVGEEDVTWSMA